MQARPDRSKVLEHASNAICGQLLDGFREDTHGA